MRAVDIIRRHEKRRKEGINLIASENRLSPDAAEALSGDMAGRYHADFYGGSEDVRELIAHTEGLARKLFGAAHAIVTPLSGNICDLAVLFAFSRPGDGIASLPFEAGGYPLGFPLFRRRHVPLAPVEGTFEVDVERSAEVIARERPAYTMLGASYIPFPHPVKDLARPEHTLVFDGSHVMGLLATGTFQDPLGEGADILIGSTHKTLYGPQGGLILTNDDEMDERLRRYADIDLEYGLGLVDNPHPGRIAALALTLEEVEGDRSYGRKVIDNARTLAGALSEQGVPMRFGERGFTASHQIFFDMTGDAARDACAVLSEHGIFVDTAGRMGTAEVTHSGMGAPQMVEIASFISTVLKGEADAGTDARISELALEFSEDKG